MVITLSDNEREATWRKEVRSFIDSEAPAALKAAGDEGGENSLFGRLGAIKEWREKVAAKGWIAPSWPKRFGGADMTVAEQFIMNEEFAESGVPGNLGGFGVMMIGPTIIEHGTEEQKEEHLTKILKGEVIWCQGYSEPGAGSDLASLQTRAVRDGDDYVINGQKIWTTGAQFADMMYMLVRTDPDAPKHRGITYLLVNMKAPGVTVRPLTMLSGAQGFNEVFFEDVRVPVKNRIGEENRGWYVGTTTLDFERSSIGSIPNHEASMCKLFSSEMSQRIANLSMHLFGMHGNVRNRASNGYMQAVSSTIAGGTTEVQKGIIATRGLGLPRG
ncbi:MAG: acyl-CoA dehydrogenase family protein [Dehalococcoidia bacterium]|nr:acyl-CoA dehydrogenase family protein [Dehalococcoidia bacterium]